VTPIVQLAAAIAALVDERVEERLRDLGVRVESYDGASLPPRVKRRAFYAACRSGAVTGAERDGRGWKCTRRAWEAYRARGASRPVRGAAARVAKLPANDVDLDAILRAANLRGTR